MIVLRKTVWAVLLSLFLLAPAAYAEQGPAEASCAGDGYTLTASLTSSGMRAALTFDFGNQGADEAVLTVHSVALDGECTDTAFRLTAAPGKTVSRRCVWQKETLGSLTAVEVWAEISRPGRGSEHRVLTIWPLGERKIARRMLPAGEKSIAAFDDENAGVFFARLSDAAVLRESGLTFEWYLVNKGDSPLRFVMTADGQDPVFCDVIPHTVAYVPDRLPPEMFEDQGSPEAFFQLAAYRPGSGEPLFRAEYTLRPLTPQGVPTAKPTAGPGPVRIGTVTIRKSGAVNVREEGNTKAKKLGSAKAGASYPCYGVSASGWYLIELEDGTRGYVTNSYSTLVRD